MGSSTYGNSLEKAHIDIIGSSISLASKIVSIAKHNQVLIGESIYNILQVCVVRSVDRCHTYETTDNDMSVSLSTISSHQNIQENPTQTNKRQYARDFWNGIPIYVTLT
jgi:hypothetical protein